MCKGMLKLVSAAGVDHLTPFRGGLWALIAGSGTACPRGDAEYQTRKREVYSRESIVFP